MGGMNGMQGYSFGPPQNAVYGRGGVWSPGQNGGPSQLYQPMPQPWGPQGGYQNPVYGQGAQKQQPGGGWQQQNARDFYNPVNPMANQQPGNPWNGSVPGMGPQAGPTPPAAPQPWNGRVPGLAQAAPTLNTSAEVQGAPAPAGPSRLELWQQKYNAMGTRPTQNAFGAPGLPRTNGGR